MTPPLRTVSALVAYDGTDYHGFQAQANANTVQDVLERALDRFCERSQRIVGAGRTDAGVHANGQVIRTTVAWAHSSADLERAWNMRLPASIAVRCVREVSPEFHPRFDAISRTYRYTVQWHQAPPGFPAPRRSPLTDRFSLLETRALDVEAMNAAAAHLVGVHDFATFGQPPQGESTHREVLAATWQVIEPAPTPLDPFPGRRLVFTITANAFLRQMVRNLVGSLLAVGRGELTVAAFQAALAARDRRCSAPPAAPQGLVLERVTYPQLLDRWIHAEQID